MSLFNTEQRLLVSALKLIHEANHLQPPKPMRECSECADMTPVNKLVPDGRGFHFCEPCAELHGVNDEEDN